MKRIETVKYVAFDGVEFNTEEECIKYEKEAKIYKELDTMFENAETQVDEYGCYVMYSENFINTILNNKEKLYSLLKEEVGK